MQLSSISSRAGIADHHPNALSRMAPSPATPALTPPTAPSAAHLAAMQLDGASTSAAGLAAVIGPKLDPRALSTYIHNFSDLDKPIALVEAVFPQQVILVDALKVAVAKYPGIAQLYLNGGLNGSYAENLADGLRRDAAAAKQAAQLLRTLPG